MSKFERQCPHCLKRYTPDLVSRPNFVLEFMSWVNGSLIQNVWPEATPIQREQLQTGFCSDKCWDEAFAPLEEL